MSQNSKKLSIEPYLFFNGRCEEALEFYGKTLGATVSFKIRFNESPEPPPPGRIPPGFEKKLMHATFHIGDSTVMASDGCDADKLKFEGFSLSIAVATEAEVDKICTALSEGGSVQMPPGKTFWSPRFGMVTDKFGIGWMVGVPGQK